MILNKNKLSASLLILAIFSCKSYADDCSQETHDSAVYQCDQNETNNAEKALNEEYSNAKERIKQALSDSQSDAKSYLNLFLLSQRGWLALRDNQCKMEAFSADKNSNLNLDLNNVCITRMDKERINALKKIPGDTL